MDLKQENSDVQLLIGHLFRHESGKLIASLTKIFGKAQIDQAEDLVQEAMTKALEQWSYSGIPENPKSWLYIVAKNSALNRIKKNKAQQKYLSESYSIAISSQLLGYDVEEFFSDEHIKDSLLRMMFTCCHPSISQDSQIAITLKILCGFSITEIARALVCSEDAAEKRVQRALLKIRQSDIDFEIPSASDIEKRLDAVLMSLYLLFNEGYCATQGDNLLRQNLCEEAIRLAVLLMEYAPTAQPDTYSLLALMYFNAARFNSRFGDNRNVLLLKDQDRTLWDQRMIANGFYCLNKSLTGGSLSEYQLQASIAACHCAAAKYEETDWHEILNLYEYLVSLSNSPIHKLNRIVAYSKVHTPKEALALLESFSDSDALEDYYYLPSVKGELHYLSGEYDKAKIEYENALQKTRLYPEILLLTKRRDDCIKKISRSMSA